MADATTRLVNVYDFDHTIYRGDSSLDFYWFCAQTDARVLLFLPYQCWNALLFVLHIQDRTRFKASFFSFLRVVKYPQRKAELFWNAHTHKLKSWYLDTDHTQDIVLSAGPTFLLAPLREKLGISAVVATKMDPQNGHIEGLNCRGAEKVRRFREVYPHAEISQAFGDSTADLPILSEAKAAFIVAGSARIPVSHYRNLSTLKRLMVRFTRS